MSKIQVQLSNRVRLAAAVLAAGDWPDFENTLPGAGGRHPQADATRQYVLDYADYAAVQQLNQMLPDDLVLADLFSTALRCAWPTLEPQEPLPGLFADGVWAGHLGDFYVETAIAAFFWADNNDVWLEAESDLKQIFSGDALGTLLSSLAGKTETVTINIVPNLVYPTTQVVIAANTEALYVVVPPLAGKGESVPRTYREGAGWLLAEVCYALVPRFLGKTMAQLSPEQASLLRYAVTAAFVENASNDEAAALFYRIYCKNEVGLDDIDEAVENVQRFLAQPQEGELASLFSPSAA